MAKTRAELRQELADAKRRETYRKARHDHWQRLLDHAREKDAHPRQYLVDKRDHWSGLLKQARQQIDKLEAEIGPHGHANGIDVSSYQPHVDWAKVKAADYTFAYVKLTQGTTYVNPYADFQVRGARKAGLKVGGYHFLEHGNIDAQAEHFVSHLKSCGLRAGDLRPAQDVETIAPPNARNTPSTADAAAFAGAMTRLKQVHILLYTFPAFAHWETTSGCPLWIANFGVASPAIPHPWKTPVLWQHSSNAHVPGVAGDCDVNVTQHIEELIW